MPPNDSYEKASVFQLWKEFLVLAVLVLCIFGVLAAVINIFS